VAANSNTASSNTVSRRMVNPNMANSSNTDTASNRCMFSREEATVAVAAVWAQAQEY